MNNQLVSIMLSVYKKDNPEYLKLSLDSVLRQTYENVLLVIGVDGTVEDNLGNILREYEKNPKVKVVWREQNRGLAAILNDVLEEAKTSGAEYFARMDADDICREDRFEKQVRYLEENPEIDIVGGAIAEIDENSNLNGKEVHYPLTHADCLKFFETRDPVAHPAVMFRKSFFDKVTCYNVEYRKNQDTELWYRAFKNGCKFANLNDIVLSFRVSNELYKRRGGMKFAKDFLNLRMKVIHGLGFGIKAKVYAYAYFCMAISPNWIKKLAYTVLR